MAIMILKETSALPATLIFKLQQVASLNDDTQPRDGSMVYIIRACVCMLADALRFCVRIYVHTSYK